MTAVLTYSIVYALSYYSFYNTDKDQCAVELSRAGLRGGQARQLPGILRHHWNNNKYGGSKQRHWSNHKYGCNNLQFP